MSNGTPKPVYAIVGKDVFLQIEALSALLAKMPADKQRVDLDGDTAPLAGTLDELRSFSMFGGHKVVVIRSADDFVSKHRDKLEAYLQSPGQAGTMILRMDSLPKNQRIYKLIEKVGEVIACEPPKPADVAGWILNRSKHHKLQINAESARVLADLIGNDLGRLDNELARLALQCDGPVKPDDVKTTVAFQREQAMWDMTDALTIGRPDEAIRRWRQLVLSDPSTEFRAVTWLALWVEKASRALAMKRQRMNAFTIAKELKIWPAANAEKLLVTVEKLGEKKLDDAVGKLIAVDKKNKSGLGDPVANVELFLMSMA